MVTFGTTAPVGSVTVPVSAPVPDVWLGKDEIQAKQRRRATSSNMDKELKKGD